MAESLHPDTQEWLDVRNAYRQAFAQVFSGLANGDSVRVVAADVILGTAILSAEAAQEAQEAALAEAEAAREAAEAEGTDAAREAAEEAEKAAEEAAARAEQAQADVEAAREAAAAAREAEENPPEDAEEEGDADEGGEEEEEEECKPVHGGCPDLNDLFAGFPLGDDDIEQQKDENGWPACDALYDEVLADLKSTSVVMADVIPKQRQVNTLESYRKMLLHKKQGRCQLLAALGKSLANDSQSQTELEQLMLNAQVGAESSE